MTCSMHSHYPSSCYKFNNHTFRAKLKTILAQVVEALQRGASNEALVCVAGYVLGEYGRLLPDVPIHAQFLLLQERFVSVSPEAKVCASSSLLL